MKLPLPRLSTHLLLSLSTITLAAPTAHLTPREGKMDPGLFTWTATDWVVGCSPAACGWGFNVTAPANYIAAAPEFKMTCGALWGRGWMDCRPMDGTDFELPAGSKVMAYWPPDEEDDSGSGSGGNSTAVRRGIDEVNRPRAAAEVAAAAQYTVRLAHIWYDAPATAYWNATGEATATAQTMSFGITGKFVQAVVQGWEP